MFVRKYSVLEFYHSAQHVKNEWKLVFWKCCFIRLVNVVPTTLYHVKNSQEYKSFDILCGHFQDIYD